jgi:hypothetical protein
MAAAIEGRAGLQAQRAGTARIVLASLVGTTIEFYDFYQTVRKLVGKLGLRIPVPRASR